jgi:NAD(P)H-flavin reductase
MMDFSTVGHKNPYREAFLAPKRTVVTSSKYENSDTVTLGIKALDDSGSWKPGQFNMLYLFGLGEIPISISGDPSISDTVTHTIKALGAVSKAITDLKKGDAIWMRGPFGQPWPEVPRGHDLLIVAGGLGLAPLTPVIFEARASPHISRIMILYGARTPSDTIFQQHLSEWAKYPRLNIQITVDRLAPNTSSQWHGSVGMVTNLLHHLDLSQSHTLVMTCGPEIMMRHVVSDVMGMGISAQNIYVSMERNMKCAVGVCGRCQWGPHFVCRDGPVYRLSDIRPFWNVKEF